MPRANRCFLPGYLWHITHRCHRREFLLRFIRDRCRYLHRLFKAKKRQDLTILNYMVTSNHIHLLIDRERAAPVAGTGGDGKPAGVAKAGGRRNTGPRPGAPS